MHIKWTICYSLVGWNSHPSRIGFWSGFGSLGGHFTTVQGLLQEVSVQACEWGRVCVCRCGWVWVSVQVCGHCLCRCVGICADVTVSVLVCGCLCKCVGVCAGVWLCLCRHGCVCAGVCACVCLYRWCLPENTSAMGPTGMLFLFACFSAVTSDAEWADDGGRSAGEKFKGA